MSGTNEYVEIRICNLVATKAHEQFRLALLEMKKSLELYGHEQPEFAYTDNMADRAFLEECLPSLRRGITPVEKYADLEPFTIPESPNVHIYMKQTASGIDMAARAILDSLPDQEGPGLLSQQVFVGFDTEWNVEARPYGGVVSEKRTAVVQIAYKNIIYILQVREFTS